MNCLSAAQRSQVVSALIEGNSIRATVRTTGVWKDTVVWITCGSRTVILEQAPQLGDGTIETVVRYKRLGPDGLKQLFFGNRLTPVSGQAHEHFHDLRF